MITTILCMLLNFSTLPVSSMTTCNELVEIKADHDTATKTYKNRYKIPVVDKRGKMMFHIEMERRGTSQKIIMTPVRDCRFDAHSEVTITFSDRSKTVITSSQSELSSHIEISLDAQSLTELMITKVLSISFSGLKYDYEVVLKPNQGRVVQDVINCIQH